MFHIEFFTDDRYVVGLMKLLAGKTHDFKCTPVVGVKKLNGKLAPTTDGRVIDLLAAHLAKAKPKQLRRRDLATFLEKIGRAPGSASYLASEGVKARLLQQHGAGFGTYYTVVPKTKNIIKSKKKKTPPPSTTTT